MVHLRQKGMGQVQRGRLNDSIKAEVWKGPELLSKSDMVHDQRNDKINAKPPKQVFRKKEVTDC